MGTDHIHMKSSTKDTYAYGKIYKRGLFIGKDLEKKPMQIERSTKETYAYRNGYITDNS